MHVMPRELPVASAASAGGGERAARFEAVFAAYADRVFAYARRRATRAEAEDVVSETFLVAWRRLDDVPDEPLAWLIGVARKTLANARRGEGRRAALGDRLRVVPGDGAEPDPVERLTTAQRIRHALRALPAGEREVIELVAWDGLSPAEVATALGIARATVYVRLHRARQRLAGALEEEQ
jgi:RNA polymerase sigma-70 factor (ECF subfamily)